MFNCQYKKYDKPATYNSGVKHQQFVDERPLTVTEMYNRAVRGIPLSVPTPICDRIPINNSFYADGFDVLDLAIANSKRISDEQKAAAAEESKRLKEEQKLFEEWKVKYKNAKPSDLAEGTIPT